MCIRDSSFSKTLRELLGKRKQKVALRDAAAVYKLGQRHDVAIEIEANSIRSGKRIDPVRHFPIPLVPRLDVRLKECNDFVDKMCIRDRYYIV